MAEEKMQDLAFLHVKMKSFFFFQSFMQQIFLYRLSE